MRYYVLRPDVGGRLHENTVFERTLDRPEVDCVHYVFDGWEGDELLTSFPVFIITESMCQALLQLHPTGCEIRPAIISTSELFQTLHAAGLLPAVEAAGGLPPFRWLHITGHAGVDDFGWSTGNHLVVSERIVDFLETRTLPVCEGWEALPDDLGITAQSEQLHLGSASDV